jgi:hypothetical protein
MNNSRIRLIAFIEVVYFADIVAFCLMTFLVSPSTLASMAIITAPLGFVALAFWILVLVIGDKAHARKLIVFTRIGYVLTCLIAPLQFISVAVTARPYSYAYSGTHATLHLTVTTFASYPGFIIPMLLAWILRRQTRITED